MNQDEPRPNEVWRSVTGEDALVRRVWTSRKGNLAQGKDWPPGTRMVEVKRRRRGRSGPQLHYFSVAEFTRNWARLSPV